MEESAISPPAVQPQNAPDTVPNLVARLTAIRERLFWLTAYFATTLSADIAREADRYQDPDAVQKLVQGHESLLLAELSPRPTLPMAAQQWFELAGEVRNERSQPVRPMLPGYLPDGLSRFV
jgi:hypothetical protein